jgi:hypothetical protein
VIEELKPVVALRAVIALRATARLWHFYIEALTASLGEVGAGRPPSVSRVVVERA